MKLMVLSTLYAPRQVGGAEKIAQVLAEALSARGHECAVATLRPEPGAASGMQDGVRVHAIGLRNFYWPYDAAQRPGWLKLAWHLANRFNPMMGREVGRLLDRERPDVLHTHALTGFSAAAWAAARARGIPVVHTLHDYSLACPRASMFREGANCAHQCRGCRWLTSPALQASRRVQAVAGVSRFTLKRHQDLGYFRGVPVQRVIHNGLPGGIAMAAAAREPGARLRLGYVGRLARPKGIDVLLRVMRALEPDDCELVVAGRGSGEEERQLRELAPANVRFEGFVDPDQLYPRIDVLVVPSVWQDPLPTTVIEAMRHGVPAIVSDRGGLPDLVLHGRTGRVYRMTEADGLRHAIDAFLARPGLAARMAPAVLERAGWFGADRMAAEYEELLLSAVAAARERNPRRGVSGWPGGSPAP